MIPKRKRQPVNYNITEERHPERQDVFYSITLPLKITIKGSIDDENFNAGVKKRLIDLMNAEIKAFAESLK